MEHRTKQSDPAVSVVIASGAEGEFLFRCLDSLRDQVSPNDAEILVVDRCGGDKRARIASEYPFVTLVPTDPAHRSSVPELRKLGVEQARGEIIAIIEEHCVAPPDWVSKIRTGIRESDAAIGGPILDDHYGRVADWAVYFSEYHNYLPPWPDGERYLLNGANIAYSRQKLSKFRDELDSGFWEAVVHPQLQREGAFRAVSDMGVRHTGPFDYRYYLGQRYLLSRVWGGTQRQAVSLPRRLAYLVIAPGLPPLLLARIALKSWQSRQQFGKFLVALPLLVPVTMAYVWGEWLGYLLGMGDALQRVE